MYLSGAQIVTAMNRQSTKSARRARQRANRRAKRVQVGVPAPENSQPVAPDECGVQHCTDMVLYRGEVGCAERPALHEVLGYYAIERIRQKTSSCQNSPSDDYWERPRVNVEVVVPAAPCPVRDTTLPLGPALDGREASVGWLTDAWRGVGRFVNSALRCCVGNSGFDEMVELERRREAENRREMLISRPEGVVKYTRPDLTRVAAAADEGSTERGVVHRPRIVVEATVHLRLILGTGAMNRDTPGNVALVRSEAAKYMRERPNMRKMDAAAHLDLIEECFFDDLTHYNTTRWRKRLEQESFLTRLLYSRRHHTGVQA